jgi:hypothetical protein
MGARQISSHLTQITKDIYDDGLNIESNKFIELHLRTWLQMVRITESAIYASLSIGITGW